jgi:DNA (cytosine-5)-methyltransferase 1
MSWHFSQGGGGGILGGKLLGWRTVCAVEFAAYPRSVLLARQRDGLLDPFPIWDDVRTFDGRPWRGKVDVISGGFPCQDISVAGKGAGIEGERSGLWREMARIIREVGPRYVFVENSPALVIRGLGRVLGDLAEMGYDANWGVLGAVHAGAVHGRERIWIHAFDPLRVRVEGFQSSAGVSEMRPWGSGGEKHLREALEEPLRGGCYPQPLLRRVDDGVAARVDRLKAIGNGQVPSVAALAWRILSK